MVCLVEVVLEPGKRACPPLCNVSRGADRLECAAHPGYAGVGVPGELHHCGGRQRLSALLSNPSVSCFGRLSTLTPSLQQLSDQRLMLDPALTMLFLKARSVPPSARH